MKKMFIAGLALCTTLSIQAAEADLQAELEAAQKKGEAAAAAKAEKPWTYTSLGSLQFSQAAFDNWSGGGENSLAWQARFKVGAYYLNGKHGWNNKLNLAYGKSKIGDLESRKALDEILAETLYSYKTWETVHPFVSARFESQLDEGFAYTDLGTVRTSKFMDPGYFTESAGLGWIPNKVFKSYLGASFKQTVTDKHPRPYADDPETLDVVETTRSEAGVSSVSELNWQVTEKSLFSSSLDMFSNLQGGDEIDVRWKNALALKLSSILTTNIEADLFYDKDISRKRQLRQALTVGLSYSFL